MNKSEFIEMLHEVMELDSGELTQDSVLDDIEEWDSVSLITFMAVVDDNFEKMPSPDEIAGAVTVGDLMGLFGEQIS